LNQELLLEHQRFRGDGTGATGAEKFCEGDEQVNCKNQQIAHEPTIATLAILCKTALQGFRAL
jgi:hypothetical protein